MTTISDKDRAEAQAMSEALHGRGALPALSDNNVRRWLAVRDHVLATHECPSLPVWRPTTADEIQPGWEIRSRHRNGSEATWGVAHHQDGDGDWYTEAGNLLTLATAGWTYETTAPPPEPWDGEVVGLVGDVIGMAPGDHTSWQTARAVLNLLAERGLIERPGGEHRKMRNPYRPEPTAGEATAAPVTPAAPDAINPPPDPSEAVTGPHSPERTQPMTATTTHAIRLLDCPACAEAVEMVATYDVRLDQSTDVTATEKVVTAKLKMTGARIQHNCQPTATRATRED